MNESFLAPREPLQNFAWDWVIFATKGMRVNIPPKLRSLHHYHTGPCPPKLSCQCGGDAPRSHRQESSRLCPTTASQIPLNTSPHRARRGTLIAIQPEHNRKKNISRENTPRLNSVFPEADCSSDDPSIRWSIDPAIGDPSVRWPTDPLVHRSDDPSIR